MTTSSTPRVGAGIQIRPFAGEYERLVEIGGLIDPDERGDAQAWRYHDEHWPAERYWRTRVVAEDGSGNILGWAEAFHMPWQFHPDKYRLSLAVDPAHQRRGVGSALYEHALAAVRERRGIVLRSDTQESRRHAIDFLAHRGFEEIQRYWESRLAVAAFDFAAFDGAEERAAREGVTLTTLAAELARAGESVLPAVHECDQAAFVDVPFPDPATPIPFDVWLTHGVKEPNSLLDAFFLAKAGDRYVGLSNMNKNPTQPGVLFQGFTGVIREARGKGVAMALKLQTVRYALAHGYREIRTGNNTSNRPMLRINEAMGFVKQPVWIEYEQAL